ncbi:toll/interleukin-1 receptor domain-containing protein [Dyadobacter bucti]|uniref:toll/interleukin-1 receptor domain-containing protein n=1 Tax=Dyadobacter bucti TaxID=2572203 RepID=UPI001408F965|nr:toll/interleukin-1 receptor domain-containing protein [Dyadobacter bucti]
MDKESIVSYVQERWATRYVDNRGAKYNQDGEIADFELYDKKDEDIFNVTIKNIRFTGKVHRFEFQNCNFINCDFEGFDGFFLIFTNCKFYKCNFRNCKFSHIEFAWDFVQFIKCQFQNVEWHEAGLFNIYFSKCYLQNFRVVDVNPIMNVNFDLCTLDRTSFEYISNADSDNAGEKADLNEEDESDLNFSECEILDTNFNTVNLSESIFYNSGLYKCSFIDCKLGVETFIVNKVLKNTCYASMDFQTILKSEQPSEDILSIYFNIVKGIDIKKIVKMMTTEVPFYTVFISYSLKDRSFAKRINDSLVRHGLTTFLWEKDAPAGQPLEEIMYSGVRTHGKLLFIASEHSIRSKACQFELTEGRKRQEENWSVIFFPVHIDNYLFEVQKNQIKPASVVEDYWENIVELRKINSLDFSKFNSEASNEKEFEQAIDKLVLDLKMKDK